MSQNNSNEKAAMLAKIETIHQVDGFDPTPFAVDYTDLGTGEVRSHPCKSGNRESEFERVLEAGREPCHKTCPGDRRRYCRYPDRT